jgi:hypothetical protein
MMSKYFRQLMPERQADLARLKTLEELVDDAYPLLDLLPDSPYTRVQITEWMVKAEEVVPQCTTYEPLGK